MLYYDPEDQVLVTVGVSEALFLALKAILDPGDEVLVVQPCFVANAAAVEMAGGVPVIVDAYVENEFQVTGAELEAAITPRTKAILISYPNNPTGAILSREHMLEIAAVAEKHDLLVISDEIYERLVYDAEHICFATLPGMYERTIVLSGMSKSFAMTGWRIGYALRRAELMEAMRKLHQYLIMSAPTMGQVAAMEALLNGEDDVETMRGEYDRRRRLIVGGFNDIGHDLLRAARRVLRLPQHSAERHERRGFLRDAAARGTGRGRAGERLRRERRGLRPRQLHQQLREHRDGAGTDAALHGAARVIKSPTPIEMGFHNSLNENLR